MAQVTKDFSVTTTAPCKDSVLEDFVIEPDDETYEVMIPLYLSWTLPIKPADSASYTFGVDLDGYTYCGERAIVLSDTITGENVNITTSNDWIFDNENLVFTPPDAGDYTFDLHYELVTYPEVKSEIKTILVRAYLPALNIPTFVDGAPGYMYFMEAGHYLELVFDLVEADGDSFTIDVDMGATEKFGYFETRTSSGQGSLKLVFEPLPDFEGRSTITITIAKVYDSQNCLDP